MSPPRTGAHPGATAGSKADDHVLGGILSLCAGLVFFSFQDAAVKQLAGQYSVYQILLMRSVTAAPLLALFVYWRYGLRGLRTGKPGLHAIRCICVLCAFLCFYTAVSRIPLVDVVSLFGAAPLFITALAGPVLGEAVGIRRWTAVCVGFAGVLIMLQPGSELFNPIALLAALAAVFYSFSCLAARALGRSEPSGLLALYSNLTFFVGCGLGLAIATAFATPGAGPVLPLWHPYVSAPPAELGLMLSIGLVTMFGFILVPRAYQIAPASVVTPFEYTYLLWAMLIGFFLFDEVPSQTTLAGAALVVCAGVYIARREASLARRARPDT